MSKVTISGNASGTGTLLIAAPNTNSDITLNLPTTMGTNNGSSVVTTDAAGNLGLGVAPSAWVGFPALQIKNGAIYGAGTTDFGSVQNGYFSSGWKYIASSIPAALYSQSSGVHAWSVAPSGTAGAAISFVQAMTLDASGNLGLGVTPSAWDSVVKVLELNNGVYYGAQTDSEPVLYTGANNYYGTGAFRYKVSSKAATRYQQDSGIHKWYTAPSGTAGNAISFTQAMTLDASGNLGVGTTSPNSKVQINTGTNLGGLLIGFSGGSSNFYDADNQYFRTGNGTERARIDSSGNLLVGTTTGAFHRLVKSNASDYACAITNTSATTPFGLAVSLSAASPNDATRLLLQCEDSTQTRAQIRSNGGLANYSANNVNISDERTKTDIVDAGNYLAKICAIPIRTFKYKDQTDDLLNLGVIAQEVEVVAPELVDVSGFGATPEDGVPLKAIYQTDLQYALMKCIQELKAIVDAQGAEIATLKGTA